MGQSNRRVIVKAGESQHKEREQDTHFRPSDTTIPNMAFSAEMNHLIVPWGRGQMQVGHGYVAPIKVERRTSLRERFENQVERTPENSAVITDDEILTYRELNRQANVIAHKLLEFEFQSSGVVPLIMSLGSEKIAAALGTMKAGLAWTALDEGLSGHELGKLVTHGEARVLLTDRQNHDRTLSWNDGARQVIDVSSLCFEREIDNPNVQTSPDSIIAIRYTSGSSGAPKGVIETDRIEQYLVDSTRASLKHGPHDRVALLRNFWLETLFTPLCCGACLCPFDLKERGLAAMRRWLRNLKITVYDGMVTGFRELLGSLGEDDYFPSMRVVALSGESVIRDDVLLFDSHFSKACAFKSYYGSTEHGRTAEFTIDRERVPTNANKAPIGYPVDGIRVELWDEDCQPVAPGEIGEIVVCGDNLNLGYWSAPELTATVWPEIRGKRVHTTGDLAVAGPDGCLYLLDRKDEQIKVGGYRIMPSEIETMLASHEGIARAAVATYDRPGATLGLAGYYVAQDNHAPSPAELRAHLNERLPHYMIPHAFVWMEALPLTGSGKVKRRSLPAPNSSRTLEVAGYCAPENELEVNLATIWGMVLEVDRPGVDDDFLELGGDSLLAMSLIHEIHRNLRISITIRNIFEAPTIRQLAESIESGSARPKPGFSREF